MHPIEQALRIALESHAGQVDKAGQPYNILHPLRVMQQVDSDEARIVALLHDVVEDSDVTLDDLREAGFGTAIVEAVALLTKDEATSYEDYLARLAANPLARTVKLADLAENLDLTRIGKVTQGDLDRLNKYLSSRAQLLECEVRKADS